MPKPNRKTLHQKGTALISVICSFFPMLLALPSTAFAAYGVGEFTSPFAQGFLGLVVLVVSGLLIVEAIKQPRVALIMIATFAVALLLGFGTPILITKVVNGTVGILVGGPLGLTLAMSVFSLSERIFKRVHQPK